MSRLNPLSQIAALIVQIAALIVACFLFVGALAYADNFLRDDGTFQPVTSSSQSVTAGTGLAVSPSPCTGTCSIGINPPVSVPNGGTGNITATAHSLPVNEGTSAQANTGTGASGQCLLSNGATANPSFKSGCRVLLATLTASASATLDDQTACGGSNCITSTYSDYELVFENLLPATNNATCEIQIHSGGSFRSTTYLGSINFVSGGLGSGSTSTTFIPCSQNTDTPNTGPGISGTVRIHNPSSSSQPTLWSGQVVYLKSSAQVNQMGGAWNSNAATDGFQVLFNPGNIASGSIKIYGLM